MHSKAKILIAKIFSSKNEFLYEKVNFDMKLLPYLYQNISYRICLKIFYIIILLKMFFIECFLISKQIFATMCDVVQKSLICIQEILDIQMHIFLFIYFWYENMYIFDIWNLHWFVAEHLLNFMNIYIFFQLSNVAGEKKSLFLILTFFFCYKTIFYIKKRFVLGKYSVRHVAYSISSQASVIF